MKIYKLAFIGALMIVFLSGCGCSTQENYDNTVATHTPSATESAMNEIKDDTKDMIDSTGDIVKDAGDAVNQTAEDAKNAMK